MRNFEPCEPLNNDIGIRGGASRKDADALSQREMIVSPSDHSSVAAAIAASANATSKSKNRNAYRDDELVMKKGQLSSCINFDQWSLN